MKEQIHIQVDNQTGQDIDVLCLQDGWNFKLIIRKREARTPGGIIVPNARNVPLREGN